MLSQVDPKRATDSQLLARIEDGRDQRAFAELVRRHGSMVMATVRRVLANRVDAEEAFQATLFILAKASGMLRQKAAVAGWLHKTAYSCAVEVQRANARRPTATAEVQERARVSSSHAEPASKYDPSETAAHAELKEILDQEVAKLPQALRAAIVLCDLEGLTQKQAAKRLGIPASTVNDRVAKGRRMLRGRLIRFIGTHRQYDKIDVNEI